MYVFCHIESPESLASVSKISIYKMCIWPGNLFSVRHVSCIPHVVWGRLSLATSKVLHLPFTPIFVHRVPRLYCLAGAVIPINQRYLRMCFCGRPISAGVIRYSPWPCIATVVPGVQPSTCCASIVGCSEEAKVWSRWSPLLYSGKFDAPGQGYFTWNLPAEHYCLTKRWH